MAGNAKEFLAAGAEIYYSNVSEELIGEAVFWQSLTLAIYAAVVFIGFNLFIILHEEPRLRRDFGAEYEEYFQNVRRWL